MTEKKNLKVIIVGGGVAGLTLANSLQYAGVDYCLVEKGERLDPESGASIGILPNGARILDQIGCFDDLMNATACMKTTASHRHDGSVIGDVSDSLQLMQIRTGYAVIFLDRTILLRVLANHIQDKNRVMLGRSVKSIEQTPDIAYVHCSDGTTLEGDIVVGADGTYSFVRQEMWRHASELGQGKQFDQDKKAMSAEYMCLFGISKNIEGMQAGQTDRTYAKDMSTLSYVGKNGRVFWFVFAKMDQVYYAPSIPRYTEQDAEDLIKRVGHLAIREKSSVTVRDLYDTRMTSQLVAIEEAAYQQWSSERIVCLGDSIHKMTANLGAGASSAIESAAALSNVLVPLGHAGTKPPLSSIQEACQKYQETRSLRVSRAMGFSNALTRVQALKGTREYIYTHYIAPRSEDSAVEMFSNFVIGAERINHLPVPERSLQGTMPFNPRHGWGYEETKKSRFVRALPLLLLTLTSTYSWIDEQKWTQSNTPLKSASSIQAAVLASRSSAVVSYDVIYGLWLIEAVRSINKGKLLQLSTLFGIIASYLGSDITGPMYLCMLYVYSPIENFRAADNRLTDMSYIPTVGPLLTLLLILPRILARWSLTSTTSHWIIERHPYVIGAAQIFLAFTVMPRSQPNDRLWAVQKDVHWVRATVGFLLAGATFTRANQLLTHLNRWQVAATPQALFNECSSLMVTELPLTASIGFWWMLVHYDLQKAGMTTLSRVQLILICITLGLGLGPGILLGAAWLWREEVLISRKHKDALVRGAHRKPNMV